MKITKYKHACLDISADGGRLIVDPGAFSDELADYSGVTAVIVTHYHQDHLDESKILKLVQQNPSLVIYGTQQVADALSEDFRVTVPNIDVEYEAGPFTLEFFGGLHAVIIPERPQDQNFGVLINGSFYYPGDSFTACSKPHQVTAVPSVAPWAKLSESADFIKQDSAAKFFPTHNAILSEPGHSVYDGMFKPVADNAGKEYVVLKPGDSIDV